MKGQSKINLDFLLKTANLPLIDDIKRPHFFQEASKTDLILKVPV